jgi:hypothetical protein
LDGDVGSPGTVLNLPSFSGLTFTGSNGFQFGFVTQPNLNYTVQYKNNLTDPQWQTLTNFTATSASFQLNDPVNGTNTDRFYRVMVVP